MTFTSDARKNKYQSFNNLGNEAEISLYFDLIFRTYAVPKLKAAYSNITSLRFFVQKNKLLPMRKRFWRSNGLQNQKNLSIKNHFSLFFILGRGICQKMQKFLKTNSSSKYFY